MRRRKLPSAGLPFSESWIRTSSQILWADQASVGYAGFGKSDIAKALENYDVPWTTSAAFPLRQSRVGLEQLQPIRRKTTESTEGAVQLAIRDSF